MFKQILTLLRGRAFEAEQKFPDGNAFALLGQQIRDAAATIQSARRAVAIAIAQNEQEVTQYRTAQARIADLESLRATLDDRRLRGVAAWSMAQLHMIAGRDHEAIAWAEEALNDARTVGDRLTEARALVERAGAAAVSQPRTESLRMFHEALEAARAQYARTEQERARLAEQLDALGDGAEQVAAREEAHARARGAAQALEQAEARRSAAVSPIG